MTIGAVSFQPYVYTVNSISPASMNRLSKISDDVLDKKIDYSELASAENENPLKKGQTLDFQGMLEMQMQRGRYHASRIMKPAVEEGVQDGEAAEAVTAQVDDGAQMKTVTVQNNREAQAEDVMAGSGNPVLAQETVPAEDVQTAAMDLENDSTGSGITKFRMQQAISAYEMFMTA